MEIISTLKDLNRLQGTISENLFKLVSNRFHVLYSIYCASDSISLAQFTLAEFGEIYLVQSYEEVKGIIFENIDIKNCFGISFYCAYRVLNNDYCAEYIIPQKILSENEKNKLEEDVLTC